MSEPYQLGVASNSDAVLNANLLASPDLAASGTRPLIQRGFLSATMAYNACIESFDENRPMLLIHQDVYLPDGWLGKLTQAMAWLDEHDPRWTVLGIIGRDGAGEMRGRAWSNGIGREVGYTIEAPQRVATVDELVIVLRGGSGLRFDEQLPGFHLYGTDIVLTAMERGRTAYVFDGPVIHNSLPVKALDKNYEAAYRYMQRKWWHRLPIQTLIVPITESLWPIRRQRWRVTRERLTGRRFPTERHPDPARLARELGYERTEPLNVEAVDVR